MKRVDLEKFWNPLLYIDNILSETKEATWLTATVGPKQEAFVLERRRVRGIFLENLELNDFPLDVQVKSKINSLTQKYVYRSYAIFAVIAPSAVLSSTQILNTMLFCS